MDQPEIPQTPESAPFSERNDLTALEHAVISSSVEAHIGSDKVMIGEGEGALSIADFVAQHQNLAGRGLGEINGTKSSEAINLARADKKILERHLELFGPQTMMNMIMGEVTGGLVLSDLDPEDPRVVVFMKKNGEFVTDPPELYEKYQSVLSFTGSEEFVYPDGEVVKALSYKVQTHQ